MAKKFKLMRTVDKDSMINLPPNSHIPNEK